MAEALLSPTILFRFAAPCHYTTERWSASGGVQLSEQYALPCFAELSGQKPFAEVRMGWNEQGLLLHVIIEGKTQPPWCRDSRIEDSDGVQIWIDTRNTQNIHRAGRFCHRFAFLPTGAGRHLDEPAVALLAINRAKESPREIDPRLLRLHSRRFLDGYTIEAFLPTDVLTGFSPGEQPAIGFTYLITDRELGKQTFTVGTELPFVEDPSLWGTLDLKR